MNFVLGRTRADFLPILHCRKSLYTNGDTYVRLVSLRIQPCKYIVSYYHHVMFTAWLSLTDLSHSENFKLSLPLSLLPFISRFSQECSTHQIIFVILIQIWNIFHFQPNKICLLYLQNLLLTIMPKEGSWHEWWRDDHNNQWINIITTICTVMRIGARQPRPITRPSDTFHRLTCASGSATINLAWTACVMNGQISSAKA